MERKALTRSGMHSFFIVARGWSRRSCLAWLCGLTFLVAVASCRESESRICTDLVDAEQYAAAAKQCEKVYTSEGDPRAGLAAARAHYLLGHHEDVLAWTDRLVKAGQVLPGLWSLAATVHLKQGKTDQAEQEYRRDLAVARSAGDHRRAADILYRLFHLSRGRSDNRRLFLLASESLQEAEKSADPALVVQAAQAVYSVLFVIGDLEGAGRALEVAEQLADRQDLAGRANLLNNLGTLLFAEGRPALARKHYEEALESATAMASLELLRGIHLNLAEVHLELGDFERAAHSLAEAAKYAEPDAPGEVSLLYLRAQLEIARKQLAEAEQTLAVALSRDPIPEWAWQLEYQWGLVAEARGDLRVAEAAFGRSIAIVEDLRRSLAFDELKAWLLDDKRQPFAALFRLQARAGRSVEALATAERAQARTFLDAFLQARSALGEPAKTLWSPSLSLERMKGLDSLLAVMSESPVATLQPVEQVLDSFGDRHGLVYFEAGDELWLITVSGKRARLRSLAASSIDVRRWAGRFLAHPEDSSLAERLGGILLPPGSRPESGQAIFIIADGILGNIPFAALRQADRYLVEDHTIVMIPSLSALAALEGRKGAASELPRVLADPAGDLPAAAAEAAEVAKLLGGTAVTAGKATSDELARASRTQVLHLATHTGPGPGGPWLQLADRRVTTGEIVTSRIGPRLAVLATCASGVRPGRQMWGSVGAAFLAAGSRAVLASLWSIEDVRAREFVLRFYREGGASDPSGALARAQRVAIAEGVSPLYWGPFVLFGSDRPLDDVYQGG
jgi:tetratricopeptide (TPR) repeat protein